MPIYEFQCLECNKKFEKILSISESNKKIKCDCEKKSNLQKVVSAPSFRLDGKGWYETDFKTGQKRNLVSSESEKSNKNKETSKTNSKKGPKQDKIKD